MASLLTFRSLILCLLAFCASPATAQTQIDVDWARVDSCSALNRFVGTHGARNSYSRQIRERRARLCPRPRPSRPPPSRESAQSGYLTGQQVADLYDAYWFCYDYNATNHSCSSVERLVQRWPSYVEIRPWLDYSISEAQRARWATSTMRSPQVLRFVGDQHLTIASSGLCRNLDQEITDAHGVTLQLIGGGRTEALQRPEVTRYYRERMAPNRAVGLRCSRYQQERYTRDGFTLLSEEVYENNIRASRPPEFVWLLPIRGQVPSLRPQ